MNMMQLHPEPHPQTAGRVIDGEAVLILADSSEIKVLNDVGSRIFELADGSRSVAAICQMIAQEYDVTLEVARADVADFLRELVDVHVMVFAEAQDEAK